MKCFGEKMLFFMIFLFQTTAITCVPAVEEDGGRYYWYPAKDGVMHLQDSWKEPISYFEPDNDIKYYLYTRSNPTNHQEIFLGDDASLYFSNFNMSNPVKFTIHGWDGDYTSSSNTLPREAFLSVDDVNMITIDWSVGAYTGYFNAVRNTIAAGPSVAKFLNWLNDKGVPFSNMHIIGHSLGGQMSGIIGRNVKGEVEYITALDPANPMWGPTSQRIRKTDAKYVEVIHTNIGILGMTDPAGHNDFYPNGGQNMPGCDNNVECSHSYVRRYFAESISYGGFTSRECASLAEATTGVEVCSGSKELPMGGATIKPEYGIFALNTNSVPPFSQG